MKQLLLSIAVLVIVCNVVLAEKNVLIVVGPSNHGPGSHEPEAGARLIKHCVESLENVHGINGTVTVTWPTAEQRARANTIVFLGDTFPPNRFDDPVKNLAHLHEMMRRGCGIVCIHYATGLKKEDVSASGEHPLLGWMGGYFANPGSTHHQSYAKIFDNAVIKPATPAHPISRGWNEFGIRDEPYGNNYFGPNDNKPAPNVTVIATAMIPPEAPKREPVAWCVQRADKGRGFGIVMPHFYKNWSNDDLRTLIVNAVVWTAGERIPRKGVVSKKPDLTSFGARAVEAK
ncbi:MAG: hypothetical protein CMP22_06500 [Rickettsiales bacterium]|nr:hypothetical protein [Rickettsiales bacterium]|tara:strand:- start:581 stop:1444 length:864 start_codon:yes stop_codon:yes gene_type:complete